MEYRTNKSMKNLFSAYGGKDKYDEFLKEQIKEVTNVFNQDVIAIGKILRSHLYIEYFLIKYLNYNNINTNNKSFNDKIQLLQKTIIYSDDLSKALTIINKQRNKVAHTLKYNIDNELIKSLKNNSIIKKYFFLFEHDNLYNDPIEKYELFSRFIAQDLNNACNDKYHLTETILKDLTKDVCDMYLKEE